MTRNKLLWSTLLALAAVVIVAGVVWAAPTFERHVLGSAVERVAVGFWPLNPKHDLYLPAILR